ncbi:MULTISPECIES: DUF1329 domain-containing protein [unclassified Pseudomonas]|uniref:DUF1329 domain-containing protein n=1 Tax=unclassified Pseudomonas TaxID=196821 RepID=UPI00129DFE2F|nr:MULTISPECIES: DUF1329 domain-containing protein [unclassified Pseudomonas]MDH4656833.1 DUF1329 domain-containing protein [Pseudomonas sp. BN606]MRK24039.1 DUF1329 domain-containing protein [Pseudomonas sp. JG-B]
MNRETMIKGTLLVLSLLASSVMAAVPQQEADKLGTSLTPLGAQKEANADGSIPAWTGGLPTNAGAVDANGFLADPFANEKPLLMITASNAEQHRDKLSDGQMALFKRYPSTYRIPVYRSHRTATVPPQVQAAARNSALQVQSINDGNGLSGFKQGSFYAFPIPSNGVEVVWNHFTRYMGDSYKRGFIQATPQVDGSYTPVRFEEQQVYPGQVSDLPPEDVGTLLYYYKQRVTSPARLAGTVALVHETLDQVKEPRRAWVYNAGQRRVRRAPQLAYDGPGTASDGQRTADNLDMYNGAPDRYDWKLIGKREMYIPYNSYRMESPSLKYDDIIKAGHLNPDQTRYELHRVWEVVATLKPGARHVYAKRHMYLDEDTWQIAEVDHYDRQGQLWRVAEGHALYRYDKQASYLAAETLYDLISGRYMVVGLRNEEPKNTLYGLTAKAYDFTPAALRTDGMR